MKKIDLKSTGSEDLRNRMPRGGIQVLARKYGKSWQWVYKVVTGQEKGDARIVADAERMAAIEDKNRAALAHIIQEKKHELEKI